MSMKYCAIFNFPIVSQLSIHYISGILKKKKERKVTMWNKKQNCPMFSLCSFFEAGWRGGGSVMSSKADISW